MSSLFITAISSTSSTTRCSGIVLSHGQTLAEQNSGMVNGIGGESVSWQLVREFSADGLSHAEHLRRTALSINDFELIGNTGSCDKNVMIIPNGRGRMTLYHVDVVLSVAHYFDLVPYQSSIWLSAYADIVYEGFLGTFDKLEHQSARSLPLQCGDQICIQMQGPGSTMGLLELVESREASIWAANLYLESSADPVSSGHKLTTKSSVTLDGYRVVVERTIGHIENSFLVQ